MAVNNGAELNFDDLKARVESYQNLKKEFFALDIDDPKIDDYITLFQQFNDEFVDALGELEVTFGDITSMSNDEIDQLITLAESFVGHSYVWGAEGEVSDDKGICFDCSGFITYLMKELGLMPQGAPRLTVSTIGTSGYFREIPWDKKERGDVLCNSDLSHVVLYKGKNNIVHAAGKSKGVINGTLYFTGKAYRIKGFGVE